MRILVIDGMGGGLGKSIIESIKTPLQDCEIFAVGTNALATAAMLKAGASRGATGENAILYNCKQADFIIGAIGIILADAMLGEISPSISQAVSSSTAHKILIPVQGCPVTIVGGSDKPLAQMIAEIPDTVRRLCK